ncbi:MAG TPA: cation diffusion facilitator family transporter [Ignavibacteriaceae bacterium]|nr:cation diffusion facilitator family transporter [Ignavibacteriaceae bacterium]
MAHIHNKGTTEKNLIISIFLNAVIVAGELIAGIFSNSLALISDALHNFGDLISLVLSLIAARMKFWKANPKKSYGYRRAEIIVAFINSSTLLIIGIYIIYEAVGRFIDPQPVTGLWLIIVAGISFIANSLSTYLLHQNSKEDLNAKSAYLHLYFDALNSLLVVFAGVFIYFYNWFILDPIFSVIIGLFIIKSAWDIIMETVNILSEGTPKEINMKEVSQFISSQPDIIDVHHLHIWSLSSDYIALSAHIVVNDQLLSKSYLIIDKLEKDLKEKFGIKHPTFQLEADVRREQSEYVKIENNFKKNNRSIL